MFKAAAAATVVVCSCCRWSSRVIFRRCVVHALSGQLFYYAFTADGESKVTLETCVDFT